MTTPYEIPKEFVTLYNTFSPPEKISRINPGFEMHYIDLMGQYAQHLIFDLEVTRRDFYSLDRSIVGKDRNMELGVFPLPEDQSGYLKKISREWPGHLRGIIHVYEILASTKDAAFYEKQKRQKDPLRNYERYEKQIETLDDFVNFLIMYVRAIKSRLNIGLRKT